MLKTIDEAKECWCPHKRVANRSANNAVASNMSSEKKHDYNCIGSNCMMWRWGDPATITHSEMNQTEKDGVVFQDTSARIHKNHARRGYCGIAKLYVPKSEDGS